QGVDLEARNGGDAGDDLAITRTATALAIAIIPPQDAVLGGTQALTAVVTTEAGVTVSAGARTGSAGDLLASPSSFPLALYVAGENGTAIAHNDCVKIGDCAVPTAASGNSQV